MGKGRRADPLGRGEKKEGARLAGACARLARVASPYLAAAGGGAALPTARRLTSLVG